MKAKRKQLEVDFIGVQEKLTVQEEKSLSKFFKQKKTLFSKNTIVKQEIRNK